MLRRPGDISNHPLTMENRSIPQPGPGQVLVKIHVCGVCRTDLHVVEGELPDSVLPLIPGHEAVGTVVRLGAGVTGLQSEDRVGIAWLQGTCGRCDFCSSGRENLCRQARFTGYQVDGGYAEYAVVAARFAYPIPPVFSDDEAAPLLCAGIIGYRALRLSGIKPGRRLGLYGFGAAAHIAIQIARAWGCEVYVSSLRKAHQDLAKALGAHWVGDGRRCLRSHSRPPLCLHRPVNWSLPPSGLWSEVGRWPSPASICHRSPRSIIAKSCSASG